MPQKAGMRQNKKNIYLYIKYTQYLLFYYFIAQLNCSKNVQEPVYFDVTIFIEACHVFTIFFIVLG